MNAALATLMLGACCATAGAELDYRHGLSFIYPLEYPAGFAHFDYVDPNANRDGELVMYGLGTFDSLNPYLLKGNVAFLLTFIIPPAACS